MDNEERAELLVAQYGFDFDKIPKSEIIELLKQEIDDFQDGSSEYIRVLCGYLFCLGDEDDADLIEKAKRGINFDVGCMIDGDWIDSLRTGGVADGYLPARDELIADFVSYYKGYFSYDDN